MVTNTTMTAALRTHGDSPSVMPTGAEAFWQLAVAYTGHDAFGFGATSAHDVPLSVVSQVPMTTRRNRIATKQARPPRGNPR